MDVDLKPSNDQICGIRASSSSGPCDVAVELDVSADGAAIDKAVQKAWEAFGRIDAVINNAGIRGSVKTPLDLSEEEWIHVIKTNFTGIWLVSKSVGIRMRDARFHNQLGYFGRAMPRDLKQS
ncbi:Monensin polyketide synthase putative ketoacyl reductase [Linum perenne]